jgi:hypothetical protein
MGKEVPRTVQAMYTSLATSAAASLEMLGGGDKSDDITESDQMERQQLEEIEADLRALWGENAMSALEPNSDEDVPRTTFAARDSAPRKSKE